MKHAPVKIKEQPVRERTSGFDEVVSGYSEQEALLEASRCLQCKDPKCISGCPVNINIKEFIYEITQKNYRAAFLTLHDKNNFPSMCGRVCPAEYQCRKACVLNKNKASLPFASDESINIHFLERFAGDYGMDNKIKEQVGEDSGISKFRVAVVGSGPAGLSCAGELARKGVRVAVFEGLHKPGGVLRYGIPEFRYPRNILDYEIGLLQELGTEVIPNTLIGRSLGLEELFKEGFSAVFLGLGAGIPSFMNLPGENSLNVYSANEFLTRINLMRAYTFPVAHTPVNIGEHVCVIGGGNTAMDAARCALRLQKMNGFKPDTTILYRRTEIEMPARRLEIGHAKEEGIKFKELTQPVSFIADERGLVRGIKCLKCELGEPDDSGRRKPIPIKGSGFEVSCEVAVVAIGLNANKLLTGVTPGIKTDKFGDIIVDPQTMETSVKGVFAGGDIVGGEGTVIEAMGMAKKAAAGIIDYLRKL
jgi:glutamate synthase (NADPH/NADH) small chain